MLMANTTPPLPQLKSFEFQSAHNDVSLFETGHDEPETFVFVNSIFYAPGKFEQNS